MLWEMIVDAGGLPVQASGSVRRGALFRVAGGLLTDADLARLDETGVQTVIDFRGAGEDRALLEDWACRRGVRYVWLPIDAAGSRDLGRRIAGADDAEEARLAMHELYAEILDGHGRELAAALAVIAEGSPVAFGCTAGKDRTGLLTALLHTLLGVGEDDVVHSYATSAPPVERLRELVRERAAEYDLEDGPGMDVLLGTSEETMRVALARLRERYGSIDAYLAANDLPEVVPARLREQLVS